MSFSLRHPPISATLAVVLSTLATGCYQEGLNIVDLKGTVIIPREAATAEFTVLDENGDPVTDTNGDAVTETVTDVKLIGPVYVGLYSGITYSIGTHPLPEQSPFDSALPYGGTTIGDIRNGCLEFFQCRLISGRYVDFDEMVDWFDQTVGRPITDAAGNEVETGEFIRQTCFELLRYTTDEEIRLTVVDDKNGDGELDERDLDFVENADGDFEATFDLLQAEFFEGFSAWAVMDTPAPSTFLYNTCNLELGYQENTYNRNFRAGLQYQDVLNRPDILTREPGPEDDGRLQTGDWVASRPYIWTDPEAPAEIRVDFQIGIDDLSELREEIEQESGSDDDTDAGGDQ